MVKIFKSPYLLLKICGNCIAAFCIFHLPHWWADWVLVVLKHKNILGCIKNIMIENKKNLDSNLSWSGIWTVDLLHQWSYVSKIWTCRKSKLLWVQIPDTLMCLKTEHLGWNKNVWNPNCLETKLLLRVLNLY